MKARILKVVGVYEFDFGNDGKSTHRFTIYSTEIISGEVKLSHEHTDFKWVTKDEILKMKIEPFMIEYFKQNS